MTRENPFTRATKNGEKEERRKIEKEIIPSV
jgi:hypothetical protein